MNRRDFLQRSLLLATASPSLILLGQEEAQAAVFGQHDFWNQPRFITLYRQDDRSKTKFRIYYYANGQYNVNGYNLLRYHFRDRKAGNVVGPMDVGLFNLIYGIQQWSKNQGSYEPVYQLNSGFRTDRRNQTIEGAAHNSLHIFGKACDGRFSSIPLKDTIEMAKYFNVGGVGGYSTFVHLDSGSPRKWGSAKG